MLISRVCCFLTAFWASATLVSASATESRKPNIIFILADDLGWGDLGCYGNTRVKTPNLDRLAKQGTLFTQFYSNGSVCSPSRVAFMTSHFPASHAIHGHLATHELNGKRGMPDWLDPKVPTVMSLLKSAGYATAHYGKWHLGNGPDAPAPTEYGIDDARTTNSKRPDWEWEDTFIARSSALFVDETLRFILANRAKPFYVNLWLLAPHAPLIPSDEQMAPYNHLSLGNGAKHKSAATIYYSIVSDLDAQVGRLLKELDALGLAENTLILFSSDNGPEDIFLAESGHSGVGSAGPFRGRKRSLYEGGVRMPFIARWPGHVPANRVDRTSVLAAVDFLPTICKLVGIPSPADARLPLPAAEGRGEGERNQRHNSHLSPSPFPLPQGRGLDGEDVSDILLGKSRPRKTPLLWEWRFAIFGGPLNSSPILAVRDGDWKLLLNPDRSRVELYDLARDHSEVDNLAKEHPRIVKRLAKKALDWQATLPQGPMDASAGQVDFLWPMGPKDAPEQKTKTNSNKP